MTVPELVATLQLPILQAIAGSMTLFGIFAGLQAMADRPDILETLKTWQADLARFFSEPDKEERIEEPRSDTGAPVKSTDTWNERFVTWFDKSFGMRFFSLKGFLFSAVISLASVAAMAFFLILTMDIETRARWTGDDADFLNFFILAAAINTVPDYISLRVTRELIGLLGRSPSVKSHLAIVVADLLTSGMIIWLAIQIARYYLGLRPLSIPEVMALFSPYAIFFYSTFTTSFIAFFFLLAHFLRALLLRTALGRRLSKEVVVARRPFLTLAIAQFAISFPLIFLCSLASQKNADGVSLFDASLCGAVGKDICFLAAQLPIEEAAQLALFRRGCDGPVTRECYDDAQRVLELSAEQSQSVLGSACEINDVDACLLLSEIEVESGNPQKAMDYIEVACSSDHAGACYVQGVGKIFSSSNPETQLTGIDDLDLACRERIGRACGVLGVLHEHSELLDSDPAKAVKYFTKGCTWNDMESCLHLGLRLMIGKDEAKDEDRGQALVLYSCEQELADSCLPLFATSLPVEERSQIPILNALAVVRGGCLGRGQDSCTGLSRLVVSDMLGPHPETVTILEEVLALNPEHMELRLGLAQVLLKAGERNRAKEIFREVIEEDACQPEARYFLAVLAQAEIGPDAALASLDQVVCSDIDLNIAGLRSGFLENLGRYEEAIAGLEQAYARFPANDLIRNNLASLLSDHRVGDDASISRALELAEQLEHRTEAPYLDTRGWALTLAGKVNEGLPLLRKAAASLPDDALVRYHFGVSLHLSGSLVEATEQLAKSLKIDQHHMHAKDARERLAEIAFD